MNKNMFILASAGLLMFASSPLHLFGMGTTTPTSDKTFNVTVTQDAVSVVKTDDAITQDVKNAFVNDTNLSAFAKDVTVKTDKGVVTLSGNVTSDNIKADFGKKAQGVLGVTKVVNNLVVVPATAK